LMMLNLRQMLTEEHVRSSWLVKRLAD